MREEDILQAHTERDCLGLSTSERQSHIDGHRSMEDGLPRG